MPAIKVRTKEGDVHDVPEGVIRFFGTFNYAESEMNLGAAQDEPYPLTSVEGNVFKVILEWAIHHEHDFIDRPVPPEAQCPPPVLQCTALPTETFVEDLPEWDHQFILNLGDSMLFRLMEVCNYLGVTIFLDMCAKTVALRIKDKSVEEVREMFRLENDYTPEEERRIKEENAWAEI